MDQTVCHIKSPFGKGYVEMAVPTRLSLADLRTSAELAAEFATALCGSDVVPEFLLAIPVNSVGRTALSLVAHTIPDRIADGPEGDILVGALAAYTFIRQLLDRIASNTPMDREMYERGVVAFCVKSNPRFVEVVKMRLPALVEQAKKALPADADRTKRLARICKATMAILNKLPERMGEEEYSRWVSGVVTPKVTAAVAAAETASAKASSSSSSSSSVDDVTVSDSVDSAAEPEFADIDDNVQEENAPPAKPVLTVTIKAEPKKKRSKKEAPPAPTQEEEEEEEEEDSEESEVDELTAEMEEEDRATKVIAVTTTAADAEAREAENDEEEDDIMHTSDEEEEEAEDDDVEYEYDVEDDAE